MGVDLQELAFIFKIIEDVSFAICRRVFRSAAEVDGACDFTAGCIDRGCTIAAAVKCEHALSGGIIDDRVRLLPGGNFRDRLQRLQVENQHGRCLPVADESTTELGSDGNSLHPGRLRDIAHDAERVDVDYLNLRSVRNIKTARPGVDCKVVPTAGSRNWDLLDNRVAAILGSGEHSATEDNDGSKTESAISHLDSSRLTV